MQSVKVISLDRSRDRREEFLRRNASLDFEFVSAIDASALSKEVILGTGIFEPGLPYTMGACGNALSHYRLWEECVRTGQPLTVAEDDAIFRDDFIPMHQRLVADLPGWDIVLWGWNFDSILALESMPGLFSAMYFESQKLLGDLDAFQAYRSVPRLSRLSKCFGTPAYSISPAGAEKIITKCLPLRNFTLDFPLVGKMPNFSIDVALCSVYEVMESFVCFPPLAVTKNEQTTSTIQAGSTSSGL